MCMRTFFKDQLEFSSTNLIIKVDRKNVLIHINLKSLQTNQKQVPPVQGVAKG